MSDAHAKFELATKALLRDGERLLVLYRPDGEIDFPGGRLESSEVETPLHTALRREVQEEVGPGVTFTISHTAFVSRRSYLQGGEKHYIVAIFYECTYGGGEVVLSAEHDGFAWLTPEQILATDRAFVSADEKARLFEYLSRTA
jgi:8-oxo-dGTP pyrophosphatase MutT (NUDIX family)